MEHDADKAVPVKVVSTIMGGMVKQLGTGLEFCAVLFYHGIIDGKEYSRTFQGRGYTAQRQLGSDSYPLEVVKSGIARGIVKGIQGLIRKP